MGGGRFVAVSRGEFVSVGGTGVAVGARVKVEEGIGDGVQVSVAVNVKTGVSVGSGVLVTVGLGVGELNIVAKASIVICRSVLRVGVAVSSPVFGIFRSSSYSFCAYCPVTRYGRPNAMAQVPIINKKTKIPIFCTAVVPFRLQRFVMQPFDAAITFLNAGANYLIRLSNQARLKGI